MGNEYGPDEDMFIEVKKLNMDLHTKRQRSTITMMSIRRSLVLCLLM